MAIEFYKYHGTGNDFVLIDNRAHHFPKNDNQLVARLCDRNFGIGGDGLILLENHPEFDFKMVYYNSDGHLSSMCGNGGRCLVHFANHLGVIQNKAVFEAVDGVHEAEITQEEVRLKMNDVHRVSIHEDYIFLDTGSPHHVQIVENIEDFPVVSEGKSIRNEIYGKEGANVNFVAPISPNTFHVRTYERGVENETLSCGTGVTAVAIAMAASGKTQANEVHIETPGGPLRIAFERQENSFTNVYLIGPTVQVFKGVWQ